MTNIVPAPSSASLIPLAGISAHGEALLASEHLAELERLGLVTR
jgi:hypothetical protein